MAYGPILAHHRVRVKGQIGMVGVVSAPVRPSGRKRSAMTQLVTAVEAPHVPARYPNLSPSRLPALACLKRFWEEHLSGRRRPQEFSRPLAYGSAVHTALKRLFDPAVPLPFWDRNLDAIVRQAVQEQGYPNSEWLDADLADCLSVVSAYLDKAGRNEETLAVELFDSVTLQCEGRPITLSARFDRLVVRSNAPDRLVIVDYKTGSCAMPADAACIMLAVAKARRSGFGDYVVEYHRLAPDVVFEPEVITVAQAKATWPALLARIRRVWNAVEFPPEPGEHCAFCPVRDQCYPLVSISAEDLGGLLG